MFLSLFGGLISSASIQYMFLVSRFTYRCLFFNVFVGEGEHDVLLLFHLDLPPKIEFMV